MIATQSSSGRNVTIYQWVMFGALESDFRFDQSLRPTVEYGVVLAAGAKVLGGVRVGKGSSVGTNVVVLCDLPAHVQPRAA